MRNKKEKVNKKRRIKKIRTSRKIRPQVSKTKTER